MRQRQDATLDVRAILEAGYAARTEDPELWAKCLLSAFTEDGWHEREPMAADWRWHASELSSCPRQLMLTRAGLAKDGTRLESRLNFDVGHLAHAILQCGMYHHAAYHVVGTEMGGLHPWLNLAARADVVYSPPGPHGTWIMEIKTESGLASKFRKARAQKAGLEGAADVNHRLQVATQAVLIESLHPGNRIEDAWIVYVDKESGDLDPQRVYLDDELRLEVPARVDMLESTWDMYVRTELLPKRLPLEEATDRKTKKTYMKVSGLCAPRSDSDPKGKYCGARVACYGLPE